MHLQPLVDYFNDRFATEHHSNIRPFTIENGLVSGIFGPIQISSIFESVRQTDDNEKLVGHIAQISVTPYTHNQPSEQLIEIGTCSPKLLRNPLTFNLLSTWIVCAARFTC